MTTLKEQAEADISMFYETGLPWIDQAVFTPQVGDPVTLNVIFERQEYISPEDFTTRVTDKAYRIEAIASDLGQMPIPRTPTRAGDMFTIDSVDYEVTGIEEITNKFIVCSVKVKD